MFPGKFCWAYSTRSLETPCSFSVSANVKEGMLIDLKLSLNPNPTKVTVTFLTWASNFDSLIVSPKLLLWLEV